MSPYRIESLLSARLFVAPKLLDDRIFFESDLSGRFSLYSMARGGSVPQPLLPAGLALQHPHHIGGEPYYLFPDLGRILVMIDSDGDENYQPHWIPLDGGIPEPFMGGRFAGQQVSCYHCDAERNLAIFTVDPRDSAIYTSYLVDLEAERLTPLASSRYGGWVLDHDPDYRRFLVGEGYGLGDNVLFFRALDEDERRPLYGTPRDARVEGEPVDREAIAAAAFSPDGGAVLLLTSRFDDKYGLATFPLEEPDAVHPVEVVGTDHEGVGEATDLKPLEGDRYLLFYNIDGCSHVYEGRYDEAAVRFEVTRRLVGGEPPLTNGVLDSIYHDPASDDYICAFSTATSPAQIYTIERDALVQHSHERLLGIPPEMLAPGEDASFVSHDGLRVSARLYLPAEGLGFKAPYPVAYYVHGGPQSQERPDFTWFSMPLIQYFTLNGFAVFVPNVRGSTGYGLEYMLHVQRDWGGQDRLDHVAAVEHLATDPRLDTSRMGVLGRSYGGYMTLTLAGRHPELWNVAVDMFGPYNLFTFIDRLPETWKTFFYDALGHPEKDADFLRERSPSSYLGDLACPLLVIQGANDPRVVERESRDVVEQLREKGKDVEYLVFDNEGHDVLKFENKVRCYTRIVDFFSEHLKGEPVGVQGGAQA